MTRVIRTPEEITVLIENNDRGCQKFAYRLGNSLYQLRSATTGADGQVDLVLTELSMRVEVVTVPQEVYSAVFEQEFQAQYSRAR